jgi:uncharacterized FlaG/YvyC family protein
MISAISSAGQMPPISFDPTGSAPAPEAAPSGPPPAGKLPIPQAPALQSTVTQALSAEQAAAEAAAEVAAKVQAQVIEKATSQGPAELTFRPSQVRFQRDMETGRVAVEVYDALTGEKTGQVPNEQQMRALSNISQQIGLMLDKHG